MCLPLGAGSKRPKATQLQASLDHRTLKKGLEGPEGQARVVQGRGPEPCFLNPREGRQRAHKETPCWATYPAFIVESEVSADAANPSTPYPQAALTAVTLGDPVQWTGLQDETHLASTWGSVVSIPEHLCGGEDWKGPGWGGSGVLFSSFQTNRDLTLLLKKNEKQYH